MNKILAIFLSALLATSVYASEPETETRSDWYVSPLGSYIKSDQSRNTEDSGTNIKIGIGKEISDSFNLELGVNSNWFDRNDDPYLKQIGLELDALYFFNRESVFSPYVATGVGLLDTKSSIETNTTWSAGLGMLTELDFLKNAKLRTEVRFQQEFESSNYIHDDVLLRAGVQIPFGGSPTTIAKPKPLQKDSDGDGVYDGTDKCPATPVGIEVNSYGCELDSDNDGIVNSNDQCPKTTAASAVNADGCPVDGDDDNDGVANSKDLCPDSRSGVSIDFKGCEIKTVISLPGINFEFNSSKLTASSSATLDGAAETLKKYTEINAVVSGHTDSAGSESYNTRLSEQRAKSVLNYLVSRGVSVERLTSKGYGEARPVADNTTTQGRANNRRVELNIIK